MCIRDRFDPLHDAEHVDEAVAEIIAHQRRGVEAVDGREPVRRRLVVARGVAIIAVADDRRTRVGPACHSVMHAGEHGGYREIGIGIGAAGAMLDMPVWRRPGRDAEGHGAIVDPPRRRYGGVACLLYTSRCV